MIFNLRDRPCRAVSPWPTPPPTAATAPSAGDPPRTPAARAPGLPGNAPATPPPDPQGFLEILPRPRHLAGFPFQPGQVVGVGDHPGVPLSQRRAVDLERG